MCYLTQYIENSSCSVNGATDTITIAFTDERPKGSFKVGFLADLSASPTVTKITSYTETNHEIDESVSDVASIDFGSYTKMTSFKFEAQNNGATYDTTSPSAGYYYGGTNSNRFLW